MWTKQEEYKKINFAPRGKRVLHTIGAMCFEVPMYAIRF